MQRFLLFSRNFSTKKTYTWLKGPRDIPLLPNRSQLLSDTLTKLSISKENQATYPLVDLPNKNPQIPRYDPTTSEPLASVQNATWEQTSTIIDKLTAAADKWRKVPGDERVDIISEVTDALRANGDALAALETFEIGKIPTESRGELVEIYEVMDVLKARRAEAGGSKPYFTRDYPSSDPKRNELGWIGQERSLPLGVVGKVTAFNFPYAVYAWGAFPALVAGNSVFWKPHPDATLTSLALTKIISDTLASRGHPNLVAMASIADWELTHQLWKDERVAMWEVTGSEAMGKSFVTQVAPSFRRYLLELGGNNAVIVHEDAVVENAIESSIFGAAGTAGQRCTTTRIIYAHESIYDKFTQGLIEGYGKLRIGDPFQPEVNVGPVHHERQVKTYVDSLRAFKSQGSTLLAGGQLIDGNFVEPAILTAPIGSDSLLNEHFVPIVHVVKYNDLNQVIGEINRTGYGLSCGVFTRSEQVFEKCVENIRVGILNKNYGSSGAEAGENFGGEGKTGNARMLGPNMFKSYTRFVNSIKSPAESKIVHAQGVTINA